MWKVLFMYVFYEIRLIRRANWFFRDFGWFSYGRNLNYFEYFILLMEKLVRDL